MSWLKKKRRPYMLGVRLRNVNFHLQVRSLSPQELPYMSYFTLDNQHCQSQTQMCVTASDIAAQIYLGTFFRRLISKLNFCLFSNSALRYSSQGSFGQVKVLFLLLERTINFLWACKTSSSLGQKSFAHMKFIPCSPEFYYHDYFFFTK